MACEVEQGQRGVFKNLASHTASRHEWVLQMGEVDRDLLGEDPYVFRNLSDNCFAHGCSLGGTVCAEVFGVQVDAIIYEFVNKAALLCAGR